MNLYIKLLLNFIFGGILFTSIYLAANVYNNSAISALICLLPLSIICLYVFNSKKIIINHCYNLIPIFIVSIIITTFLIILLTQTNLHTSIAITTSLILWFIIQYISYLVFLQK